MKSNTKSTPEKYVQEVLQNIHAPQAERLRIETDLRAHLQEAAAAGESPAVVLERMGSPRAVAAEFMAQVSLQPASFGRRLLAFAVDIFLIIAACTVLAAAAVFFSNLVTPRDPTPLETILSALLITAIISCLIGIVALILAYFPVLEGRFGSTPGKRLFGLHVLAENGLPIGYKEAVLRRLSFYF